MFAHIIKSNGSVRFAGQLETTDVILNLHEGEKVVYSDMLHLKGDYYWDNKWNSVGDPPTRFHYFNYDLKTWAVNEIDARIVKTSIIEDERLHQATTPIEVDGILLDGDENSQQNLKNKLEEINIRLELTIPTESSELFWRDYDNVTHFWNTIEEYYMFLQKYSVALSTRNSTTYLRMWELKKKLANITDPEELASFDPIEEWNL